MSISLQDFLKLYTDKKQLIAIYIEKAILFQGEIKDLDFRAFENIEKIEILTLDNDVYYLDEFNAISLLNIYLNHKLVF